MPGKQGAGRHDPVLPKVPGRQPRQGGNHHPVSPVGFRAGDLAAQTATSCRSTKISTSFGGVAPREQRQPAEQPDHEQIGVANEHDRRG